MPPTIVELGGLQTENRNPRTTTIDSVSTQELCRILHREDCRVPAAITPCLSDIAGVIDALTDRVRRGGRPPCFGGKSLLEPAVNDKGTMRADKGTMHGQGHNSADQIVHRLGVLDASEVPPTYSAPSNQFIALIAGGDSALRNAKEGAEDDRSAAKTDLDACHFRPDRDSLIGIASSGRTPYVLGGLAYARSVGGTTVGVVCVRPSAVAAEGNADHLISAVTGPESVTGSTRMKAGTATKLVLNMISTGIMIKLGKTYGNLMVDLKATNVKLRQRARNILRAIGGQRCRQSDEDLDAVLAASHGSTKLAAVVLVLGVTPADAELRLARNSGVLARVLAEAETEGSAAGTDGDAGIVLCVDAGGTSCKAAILCRDGASGTGIGGPCNVTSVGLEACLSAIADAVQKATDACPATTGRPFSSIQFAAAWVGIAGYGPLAAQPAIDARLSELLNLSIGAGLEVTTDVDLLPVASAADEGLDTAIVLVAGTGSVGMSFRRERGRFVRTGRAGGWGHLLGDDGGGFGIGREALRLALRASDAGRPMAPLAAAIADHFGGRFEADNLLMTVMVPAGATPQQQPEDAAAAARDRPGRIAAVARTVLAMAGTDADADRIAAAGADSLADMAALLIARQGIEPARAGLVLAGGLLQDEGYRRRVVSSVEKAGYRFQRVQAVDQPAMNGARFLSELIEKRR
ncbi:glucokinase regulator family protein, putative [Cordyceps militaris CM01]|uniref:N-acetyl-D-glucosamine kinase n=1 Tax=Cordyceps militaris (strain CM01) TaxID=983644 RepID=G3J4B5_CORMM|nr:glucokinase regulator family protein, putative [Cordyceps militaris CM01]EGX95837.1 glucokinase regulator family protein, putative [Cordyceps militaris CM01]